MYDLKASLFLRFIQWKDKLSFNVVFKNFKQNLFLFLNK